MTAKEINHNLEKYYENSTYYTASNIYFFGNRYCETDFLTVSKSGYLNDHEIKISRGDFFNDFNKKVKHEILSTGTLTHEYTVTVWIDGKKVSQPHTKTEDIKDYPNKFFYVVPENLVTVEEVPSYAGLMYVNEFGKIKKIKEAPFLHKNKIDYHARLCKKFYWGYKELKSYQQSNGVDVLKRQISRLEKEKEEQRAEIIRLHNRVSELNRELRGIERISPT